MLHMFIVLLMMDAKGVRNMWNIPLVVNKHNTAKLAPCWFIIYSKTCLKRNAIVPVFFFRFHRFSFYKGLCFNKTKCKKYDRLGLQ